MQAQRAHVKNLVPGSNPNARTVRYEKSWFEKAIILAVVIIPLLATVLAIVLLWERYVSWVDLGLFFALYIITGFGVTIGFHRLLTHRSFETNRVVKALLTIFGTAALQGNPINWVSTHIEHHAHSDEEGDPHSPLAGFWHAHFVWSFTYNPQLEKYGSWLRKDPMIVAIDRLWLLWVLLGLAIPFAIGGWTGLLWGGFVRLFILHHVTWSVNSVCHTFGARPWETQDASRNNWWVGLLALGEGWHNNHHAFPRMAFHGMKWWQYDFSAYLIRLMEMTGLAWNVQRVSQEQEHKRMAAAE